MVNQVTFIDKASKHTLGLINKAKLGHPCQVLIHSDKHDIHIESSNIGDMPFHGASIGKMFTATIVGVLQDKGLINIDDKVSEYLPATTLEGLFVYDGVDHKDGVTIRQLLKHTSGVADFFESKTNGSLPFIKQALNNPDKKWTPFELIEFTRNHQKTVSAPGKFFYSDTGYILLGMVIEKVCGKSFDIVLKELIFKPLGMSNSYLMFHDNPSNSQIAPVFFNGVEISQTNILSCDWAGGGIVSTLGDLLKFQQAFWQFKLVGEDYVNQMKQIHSKYHAGIHYGMGMMELHLNDFFFALPKKPRPLGHSGILATGMFYDPDHDLHIIINFGSNKLIPSSFRSLIAIEQLANKYL